MPISTVKSSTSKNSTRVRTMNQPFPQDHLCRFLLAGNRRCQRVRGCTGSGLCILHDRQLMQLRDAESKSLGDAALGQVTDFNSAVAIHAVLSRVVILGLQRRYTTKEVSVFTYAIQSLRQTLDEAAYEIRHQLGHDSRDHYIGQAIAKEPSLRQPRQRRTKESPTPSACTPVDNPAAAAQEAVRVGLQPVGARLGRDSGQASPTAASANLAPQTTNIATQSPTPAAPAVVEAGLAMPSAAQEKITPTIADLAPTESATALASIRTGLASVKTHIDSVKTSLVHATSRLGTVGVGLALPTAARKNSAPVTKSQLPEITSLSSEEIPEQQSNSANERQEESAAQNLDNDSRATAAQSPSWSKAVCV
jgi:hypothetical protein